MNILLMNNNPVVSRLLAFCTRDEAFLLEEVEDMSAITCEQYDVVFIDEDVYEKEVADLLDTLSIDKKILFASNEVAVNDFDLVIQKPFLPSQILEVLTVSTIHPKTSDEMIEDHFQDMEPTEESEKVDTTQVLDTNELEKIKALLASDDETEVQIEVQIEVLSDEELEARKIEAIKEQLIADGLEIVDEEEIVDELALEDEVVIFSDEDERASVTKDTKASKKKKKKKASKLSGDDRERLEGAIHAALSTLKPKKLKKLLKGKEVEISVKLKDNE